jgi:acyl carrier protein
MIFEKIQEALAEQFDVEPEKITRETDVINDLGADSLDLVELIMTLEDEYGVTITDESVYEHKTVGDITTFIETLVKEPK